MRTPMCFLLGTIVVVVFTSGSSADEPSRAGVARGPGLPHSPGIILQRLDKNNDGKIQKDEVPDGAPELIRAKLKKADVNGDGTISAEELRKELSPFQRSAASSGDRRPAVELQRAGNAAQPRLIHRPQPASPALSMRKPSISPARTPDAKAIFSRIDKDKDGKLTLDEFAAGMKAVHSAHPPINRPAVQHPAQPKPQAEGHRSARPSGQRQLAWSPMGHGLTGRPAWSPRPSFRPPWSPGATAAWTHRPSGFARPAWNRPPSRFQPGRGPSFGIRQFGGQPGKPAVPAWKRPGMHGPSSAFAQRLKAIDKNHDGKISKAEAPEPMQPFFDRLDVNKDGQIAPGEAMKARAEAARHKQVDAAKRRTEAAKHAKDKAADRAKGKKREEKKPRSPDRKDASRTPSSKA